ncbi:tetratricopeptide repeat protein [Geminocystis sp.]|uniref:tetratricopeptide repeat protein n=1 Tax=Geminocystis sp. TaxID=2664100 RepID=UPI003592FAFD
MLICEENYLHSEVTFIKKEIIEKIKVESILESEDIANKYNLTYPLKEVLETIFYRKLGVEAFLSRFGHLVWLDNNKYHQNSETNLVNSHFLVKKATHIKILVKTFQGNVNETKLNLTLSEIKAHQIIVCLICPNKFQVNIKEYSIINLGFTTIDLLNNNDKKSNIINIISSNLLYMGGLSYYINEVLPVNYPLLQFAKNFFKKGNYKEAIILYDKALKENKTIPNTYLLRGICKYRLGDKQGALSDFSQVIEFKNNNGLAYHWRGYIYQDLGNYEEALKNYNQEIVFNNLSFFAYYKRGLIYSKLNRLIEALEDYNMAIKINNSFFQIFYNRGGIYYQLEDKQSAIEDYKKALEVNPNLVEAYYNLGIIYQELGNYPKAIKSYQQAIRLNSFHIKSYYNLAILQANLGLYQQSINSYEEVLKIKPNFMEAISNHQSLSLLLKHEGNLIIEKKNIPSSSQKNPKIININSSVNKNTNPSINKP